jgi:hypothetical protein
MKLSLKVPSNEAFPRLSPDQQLSTQGCYPASINHDIELPLTSIELGNRRSEEDENALTHSDPASRIFLMNCDTTEEQGEAAINQDIETPLVEVPLRTKAAAA